MIKYIEEDTKKKHNVVMKSIYKRKKIMEDVIIEEITSCIKLNIEPLNCSTFSRVPKNFPVFELVPIKFVDKCKTSLRKSSKVYITTLLRYAFE